MKKYILTGILVISLLINGFLIYKFFLSAQTVQLPDDERVSVLMKQEHRDFVMNEMRTFVEGLQQINAGIIYNNPELIIKAGRRSGKGVNPPKGLPETLPMGFRKFGGATHRMFDAIADSAQTNFNPKFTQQQLNELLTNCVGCHKSFRIDVKK